MAKPPPPDSPRGEVGERVSLRANHVRTGIITHTTAPSALWAGIKWDDGHQAPKLCHLYELKIFRAGGVDGAQEC
jgi:hypothetical protein